MFTRKGKFGWYELMTSDTKAAGKFYSDVVGWSIHEMPGGDGVQYSTFNLVTVGIAGMLNVGGHTSWIGYIAVDDVDAHIERVVEAGGKLWKPATDVPGMLRFAVMSDPQGAAIVVFTPNPAMPSPERPAPPTPGTIGWHELYTTDLEAGFDFYNRLFGWTKVSDMDMGPMGVYRIFDQGDHKEMGDGGMMTKAPQIPASSWSFYFNVDSIRAAIQRECRKFRSRFVPSACSTTGARGSNRSAYQIKISQCQTRDCGDFVHASAAMRGCVLSFVGQTPAV